MRIQTYLLFLSLMLARFAMAQNTVSWIENLVHETKSDLEEYRKVIKQDSEEGAKWVYYRINEPVLIEIKVSGRIEKRVGWYFHMEKLIYTESIWTDTLDGKTVHQERTYHHEGKMIAWLDAESTFVDAATLEYSAVEKDLKAYSQKIYEQALE